MELPSTTASNLMLLAPRKIFKERFQVPALGHLWDVDVYHLSNSGLVIAESPSLSADGSRRLKKPAWCGLEITDNRRYDGVALAVTPYLSWANESQS